MSTQVNSPFMLGKIRPFKENTELQNNYFFQLERILQQLYRRSGGTTDEVSDKSLDFSASFTPLFHNYAQLPEFYSISAAHTTSGDEFLRPTAACTITLNADPDEGEHVTIQPNGDFMVTISGDINGETSIVMHRAYDLINLKYSFEVGEWSIV